MIILINNIVHHYFKIVVIINIINFLLFLAILTDILAALNTPENLEKLAEANEKSGNEMLKKMQFVFPLVIEIQIDVIKNYGFPEGREGM